ncbi:MAG: recombinase family protein [Candidatus Thiodiazotropha endolucinida]|nr:recombinase family protein [Candidatus Thiodiazotropha taylori]MCW4297080.1 recombinase family protein [Candidatus Thiodiazotropha endolucinida]
MANYAYLRVSTDQQDVINQKHGVLEYANQRGLASMQFIEDAVSGKKNWRERRLGDMLMQAEAGDTVVVSEVSRLARSTLQILEILKHCTESEINLHIAKNSMVFDGSLQSKITATVLGMAAEIEREFISQRTKEALAVRKERGIKLGRPKGEAVNLKLDKHLPVIQDYLNKGVSRAAIAKIIGCKQTTLYDYCKRKKLRPDSLQP